MGRTGPLLARESAGLAACAQNLAITPSLQYLVDPAFNPEDDAVWRLGPEVVTGPGNFGREHEIRFTVTPVVPIPWAK